MLPNGDIFIFDLNCREKCQAIFENCTCTCVDILFRFLKSEVELDANVSSIYQKLAFENR